MSDQFQDGRTDWHNWMRDTMKVNPEDKRTIEIVWACISRCHEEQEAFAAERVKEAREKLMANVMENVGEIRQSELCWTTLERAIAAVFEATKCDVSPS